MTVVARIRTIVEEIVGADSIPFVHIDPETGSTIESHNLKVGDERVTTVTATNGVFVAGAFADETLTCWQACQRAEMENVFVVSSSFNAPCAVAYWGRSLDLGKNMLILKAKGKHPRPFILDGEDQSAFWKLATEEEIERAFDGGPIPGREQ